MSNFVLLSTTVAVTGTLGPADLARAAKTGFRTVVSNLPDDEAPELFKSRQEAVVSWRNGLRFKHIPVEKHDVFNPNVVADLAQTLRDLPGPVLLHCKSGQRSALLWAAANANHQPIDDVMAKLRLAGFDFDDLRDDIAAAMDANGRTDESAEIRDHQKTTACPDLAA